MKNEKRYTLGEEIFNSISHGVGALLAVAALVLLIVRAALYSDGYGMASALVYGISLIVLYSMSMVYHIVQNDKGKRILRKFDHCSIYLLIAGTYTPYLLMSLRGTKGWIMFGLIWGAAILGIILNSISVEKFRKISMVFYICMGWAIVFSIKDIAENLALPGVVFLMVGGVVYTVGIVFYALKKYRYTHSVWHLFVLGGSVFHYFSILLYVL
jgi:hemolysin III